MRSLAKAIHRIYSPSGRGLGEKGFTLIELLVVVGILAVLAGVVTLSVGKFIGKGHAEAAATELHNIQTAVVAYMADTGHGGLPPASGDVDTLKSEGYLVDDPHGTYSWDTTTGLVAQESYP
jgi:prepilin-type N-terminal cleavage/methylation domain-containing protein